MYDRYVGFYVGNIFACSRDPARGILLRGCTCAISGFHHHHRHQQNTDMWQGLSSPSTLSCKYLSRYQISRAKYVQSSGGAPQQVARCEPLDLVRTCLHKAFEAVSVDPEPPATQQVLFSRMAFPIERLYNPRRTYMTRRP